jgi:phenylpropionate dioxygenase-like ring-hydroxylating dioxygenase large terminal subunit
VTIEQPPQAALDEGLRTMVAPRSAGFHPPSDAAFGQTAATAPQYELRAHPEPPPVPNGWYALCGSVDVVAGQVRSVIAVERELVVFRDADGVAHVLDAHCPHNGAHLGGGEVVDGAVQCPYHGWRFDGSGQCVEVPYSDARIPAKACIPSYPVREQDGFILFWFHAQGAEPTYEVPLTEEVGHPDWSDPYEFRFELTASLQEMGENNVDYAHLCYVHGREFVPNDTSEFTTDGPFSTVVESLPDGASFVRHAWGPGVALLRVPGVTTVLTTTTPIDRRHCRLHWHFLFPKAMESVADDIITGFTGTYGLQADLPIWRDKVYVERPILVKADGNVADFRRWYAQFYE